MKKILFFMLALFASVTIASAQQVREELMAARPFVKSRLLQDACVQEHFFGPVTKVVQINENFDTLQSCETAFYWETAKANPNKAPLYGHCYIWSTQPFDTVEYGLKNGQMQKIVVRSKKISAYHKVHYYEKKKKNGVARRLRLPGLLKDEQYSTIAYGFRNGLPCSRTARYCGKGTSNESDTYDEYLAYDSLMRPSIVQLAVSWYDYSSQPNLSIRIEKAYIYSYNNDNQIIKEEYCDFSPLLVSQVPKAYQKYVYSTATYAYENGVCVKSMDEEGAETDLTKLLTESGDYGPVFYQATEYPYLASYCPKQTVPCDAGGICYFVQRIAYTYDTHGNVLTETWEYLGSGARELRWEYTYDKYGNWLTRNYYENNVLMQKSERTIEVGGEMGN